MIKTHENASLSVAASCLALTAALISPLSAMAEEAAETDTIIVTARKRAEDVRSVPASVHVETAQSLERKRIMDGQAVLRDIAGASLGTFGDRSNAFVVMRGVAPILSPLSPDDSSVLTFIDGSPLPIGGSFSSSYIDLARVEVLKGPQNTLFGRNTSGGAINLIPAEPIHTFEAAVRGEIGTDSFYRAEVMANASLVPDVLAGRIAVRRSHAGGYIDNIAGEKLGKEASWVGRASLLFTPSERTRWLLTAQGEDTNTSPTTYIALRPGQKKLAAQNHTRDNVEMLFLQSRIEHDFGPISLTAHTSYSRLKDRNDYNYPDAMIAAEFSGLPASDFLDPDTNFIDWRKKDSRLSQEIRLSAAPQHALQWLVGVSFYRDEAQRDRTSEMWYFGPSATGAMTYDLTTNGQALYGEVDIPLSDVTRLSVGGRATHEKKRFSAAYSSDGSMGAVLDFAEGGSHSYEFLTGRTSLSHRWSPALTTYASISRGYKSGGFSLGNSLMWMGVAREPYASSSVMSYELGWRASTADGDFSTNGAFFLNDMKKEQMQTWDYTNFTGNTLNLDARTAGFEIDASWKPGRHWELSAGGAHTFSELRNVSAAAAAAQDGLKSGNRLPTVPQWTARAALDYRITGSAAGFGDALGSAMLNARIAYNYTGARYTDASNFGRLAPVHIVSARLGIDWDGTELYVFGDNLLDKEYMTIKDRFGTDPSGAPVFGVSYARGVALGAGIAHRF